MKNPMGKGPLRRLGEVTGRGYWGMRLFPFSVFMLLIFILGGQLAAQDHYFVYFKDKAGVSPDVANHYHPKALERRALHQLPVSDFYDLPLNADYVASVTELADSFRYSLRWFNAVTVGATPDQIFRITQLPFVKKIEPFDDSWKPVLSGLPSPQGDSDKKMDLLFEHVRRQLHLDTLEAHGLTGKGVRIAIFDAGFKGADEHPGLKKLWQDGRILRSKDFFGKRKNVYYHSGHGTSVLSCIAGEYKGRPIGAGSGAEFLLARTESLLGEKLKEEDHWLAAMEWADANGADIINSSLGYTRRRYEYGDMDGRTTRVTKAASIATRKGILVVNSQGNEGNDKFHYVGAPADADSVLAVGGTYPMVKMHIKFSSFGPNYRKVLKPNVSAPGAVLTAHHKGAYRANYGTSFSAPLVAGFSAAMKELHPEKTNMELFEMIEQLGHCWPYFDYAHGYGVPDATYLFHERDTVDPTFFLDYLGDTALVRFDTVVVNRDTAIHKNGKPFYVHFEEAETGYLSNYNFYLIRPGTLGFVIPVDHKKKGILRVWFEGFLYEEKFPVQ